MTAPDRPPDQPGPAAGAAPEAKPRFVLPGEEVAHAEEFVAGPGTFEREGRVYAAQAGQLVLDTREMHARIVPKRFPILPEEGDLVIARVSDLKKSLATAQILRVVGTERRVSHLEEAALHVSKASREYTSDIGDAFRRLDFIRARVIEGPPALHLSTAEPFLGVIAARCTECKTELVRKERDLWCPSCELVQRRKIAEDYGSGLFQPPPDSVPDPPPPPAAPPAPPDPR